MRKIIPLFGLFVLLALPACAELNQARRVVALVGANAADQVLQTSVWVTCNEASVGSVRRAYGANSETARLYTDFCNTSSGIYPVISAGE